MTDSELLAYVDSISVRTSTGIPRNWDEILSKNVFTVPPTDCERAMWALGIRPNAAAGVRVAQSAILPPTKYSYSWLIDFVKATAIDHPTMSYSWLRTTIVYTQGVATDAQFLQVANYLGISSSLPLSSIGAKTMAVGWTQIEVQENIRQKIRADKGYKLFLLYQWAITATLTPPLQNAPAKMQSADVVQAFGVLGLWGVVNTGGIVDGNYLNGWFGINGAKQIPRTIDNLGKLMFESRLNYPQTWESYGDAIQWTVSTLKGTALLPDVLASADYVGFYPPAGYGPVVVTYDDYTMVQMIRQAQSSFPNWSYATMKDQMFTLGISGAEFDRIAAAIGFVGYVMSVNAAPAPVAIGHTNEWVAEQIAANRDAHPDMDYVNMRAAAWSDLNVTNAQFDAVCISLGLTPLNWFPPAPAPAPIIIFPTDWQGNQYQHTDTWLAESLAAYYARDAYGASYADVREWYRVNYDIPAEQFDRVAVAIHLTPDYWGSGQVVTGKDTVPIWQQIEQSQTANSPTIPSGAFPVQTWTGMDDAPFVGDDLAFYNKDETMIPAPVVPWTLGPTFTDPLTEPPPPPTVTAPLSPPMSATAKLAMVVSIFAMLKGG